MDFRGTAIIGVWIGSAGMIAALNYFGSYADFSIPMRARSKETPPQGFV